MKKITIKELTQKRFNALVGMSRSPAAAFFAREVAWYSNEDETILGVVLLDKIDHDYGAIALVRDEGGRFRAFRVESSMNTEEEATGCLYRVMKWHTGLDLKQYRQGDETEKLDLFKPVVPIERLHPDFVRLSSDPVMLPARAIITEMMNHFDDIDGNFIEQFQTTGFDARLWELYLHAYIVEEQLFLDRTHHAPDFVVSKFDQTVAIEAVIVGRKSDNPPRHFKPPFNMPTTEEIREAQQNAIPMKFGSPLFSKLQKKYWELEHVRGKPLVFAIADFHDDQSMLWTSNGLIEYLYGVRHDFHHDEAGQLVISPVKIGTHKVDQKEVPSGYFFQPNAQHVGAVLFSASGTASKFNRMGRQAGFRAPHTVMIRYGACHNHDPNASVPNSFQYTVDESCGETWAEGLSMFHNPQALSPVPEELFPSIAHHHFRDGQIVSRIPEFHPYASITVSIHARG